MEYRNAHAILLGGTEYSPKPRNEPTSMNSCSKHMPPRFDEVGTYFYPGEGPWNLGSHAHDELEIRKTLKLLTNP